MPILDKLSKVWGKLSNIGKFAAHYADEAKGLANGLKVIVNALPLGSGDKAKVAAVIAQLETAAENIADALENDLQFGQPVQVKKSDVVEAVAGYFGTAQGKAVLAEALKVATK